MKKAHLTKRWSGRATVPSNFTGVHLIVYAIVTNGRIFTYPSYLLAAPADFLKEEDNLLIRCYDYTKVSTFLQIDF